MKIKDGLLFLTTEELVELGIPRPTILTGIHMFRNHKTNNWMHLGEKGDCTYHKEPLIAYDFIPLTTRKKLPSKSELIKKVIEEMELMNKATELAR